MTYFVDTCADDNSPHSLRTLVGVAASGDTIDLNHLPMACSTITLDHTHVPPYIEIDQNALYMIGPGRDHLTIDGNLQSSIFRHMGGGTLSIQGITITNGKYVSDSMPRGGCIYSKGDVYLVSSTVTRCQVTGTGSTPASGGGIYAGGYLGAHNSLVTHNSAIAIGLGGDSWGGGANDQGDFVASYSTISDNSATSDTDYSYAGGVLVWGSYAAISSSTISSNRADIIGGFDHNTQNGIAKITDSTVSGNVAGQFSGILVHGYLRIANSTIAFNRDGGTGGAGVYSKGASLVLQSSIIAGNGGADGPSDLGGVPSTLVSGKNNLITSWAVLLPPLDTVDDCPQLEPLLDNGGHTRTHALKTTSRAVDAGNNVLNLVYDQTFAARVTGSAADIGSFEWHGTPDERVFVSGFDGLCDQ